MKNVLKKTISLVLAACLISTFALADGTDTSTPENVVEIQLNGEIMEYNSGVRPYYDTEAYRTFVPFRDLFEAMGATVEYDQNTAIITATRGDTEISFYQYGTEYTIVKNGVTSTITSDVAPMTVDGRTLVPVRFASEALGANVGWDNANKTVIVVDTPTIVESVSGDYNYMNQLNTLGQLEAGKTHLTEAVVIGSIVIEDMELAFIMDMLMLMNDQNADNKVEAAFEFPEELGGNIEITMDMLIDMNTLTCFINSATLNEALGLDGSFWFEINLMELLAFAGDAGVDLGDVDLSSLDFGAYTAVTSIEDTIGLLVDSMTLTSIDDYAAIMADIEAMNAFYGDSAFIADGDYYTASLNQDGIEMTLSIELEDDVVVGYSMLVKTVDEALGNIFVKADVTANTMAMTMTIEMDGVAMDVEFEAVISVTDEVVRTAPPADAVVINILELLAAMVVPA